MGRGARRSCRGENAGGDADGRDGVLEVDAEHGGGGPFRGWVGGAKDAEHPALFRTHHQPARSGPRTVCRHRARLADREPIVSGGRVTPFSRGVPHCSAMRILTRPRLLAGATLVLALAGAWHYLGSARADDRGGSAVEQARNPHHEHATNLITGSGDDAQQPQTMEEFLTAVTTDVDALLDEGVRGLGPRRAAGSATRGSRPARPPRAPAATTAARSATAPPPTAPATTRSTSRSSSRPTSTTGALDRALPGSSQGYGGTRRRLRRRLHRRARVRPPGPGRARPVRRATAARCRRWRSSSRPTASPARGPTAPTDEDRLEDGDLRGGARRRARRRRLRRGQPRPPRHARAARGGVAAPASSSGDPSSCDRYLSTPAS